MPHCSLELPLPTEQEIHNAVQYRVNAMPSLHVASLASSLSSEKDPWLHPGSVGLGLERIESKGQKVAILSLLLPTISGLEDLDSPSA